MEGRSDGSKRMRPCLERVERRIDSVILRPEWRFRRSGLGVEFEVEVVEDAVVADEEESVTPRALWGTAERARSRLSIESRMSVAKRWMANWRALSMSRFVRSWRLRKSATERRYLSCEVLSDWCGV